MPDYTDHVLDAGDYLTWEEVRAASVRAGSHWFSESTERFFNADYGRMFGGRWMIHSFQQPESSTGHIWARRWTIAHCLANGEIDSLPGGDTVCLEFDDEDDAEAYAALLESGRVTVDRVPYKDGIICAACNGYSTWLINGDALCTRHAGDELETWRGDV